MNKSERERLGLGPPDMVEALSRHLTQKEHQALGECFRIYRLSFTVIGWARMVFLLSLATFGMGLVPVFRIPDTFCAGSGLLAGSSFLLLLLIRPLFEKAVEELQELSDKALIRARLRPVDLFTGKPKR